MRLEERTRRSRAALEEWADADGTDHALLDRIFTGIEPDEHTRAQAGPLQEPAVLVPGLEAAPWHDPARFPWVATLEAEYPRIRAEYERVFAGRGLDVHPEADDLAAEGSWDSLHFFKLGTAHDENLAACPTTASVLRTVPGHDVAGMAYFSVMGPRTKVSPHCGFVNTRIRCHLGLVVPPGCGMRVGHETRSWAEGRCLVFDDSFEHEVHNDADRSRAVLLLDTWHPDLTGVERRAVAFLMRLWRSDAD